MRERNPKATCKTCPYNIKGTCRFFPPMQRVVEHYERQQAEVWYWPEVGEEYVPDYYRQSTTMVCGQHPEFFLPEARS